MSDAVSVITDKDHILEAMLPNVLFDGWSAVALAHAAESVDISADALKTLFPGGPGEARCWLDDWADRRMVEGLDAVNLPGLRTQQRVAAAIKARLDVLAPYREAVQQALSARIGPKGAVQASQAVYRTVDTIWYAVGDESVDFSFYTKRASLAAIYVASVFYWLNDVSENATETSDFIDRRLNDLVRLPKMTQQHFSRSVRFFTAPFDLLRLGVRR